MRGVAEAAAAAAAGANAESSRLRTTEGGRDLPSPEGFSNPPGSGSAAKQHRGPGSRRRSAGGVAGIIQVRGGAGTASAPCCGVTPAPAAQGTARAAAEPRAAGRWPQGLFVGRSDYSGLAVLMTLPAW